MRQIPLLLASLLLLPGCLESEERFTLRADGSGTLEQVYAVDLRARDELLQMALLLYGGGSEAAGVLDANPVDPGWIRRLARGVEAYELKSVEETTAAGKRTTRVVAAFGSLEAATTAGAFFTSSVELDRLEDGAWRLTLRDAWQAASQAAGGQLAGSDVGSLLEGFEPQLGGLSLRRTVTLPTAVRETTGVLSEDGRTVTWTVDFARLREGKDLVLRVVFEDDEALDLTPFRHRPDLDALALRLLEPPPAPVTPPAEEPQEEGGESEEGDGG